MKKIIGFVILACSVQITASAQKLFPKEKFEQGQVVQVNLQTKTTVSQEVMGQSVEFNLDGSAVHTYKVTNATEDNNTLHHQVQQIAFSFDGMGQKLSFNSNNEKDMNGRFGKPVKEMLAKTYDMIIDPDGKVLMVQPEKLDTTKMDERMAIVTNMMKDVLGTVQPPKKGSGSLFKVLPGYAVGKSDTWSETIQDASGKSVTIYTVSDITDSTILIAFSGNSNSVSKAEMMGSESTTTLNNKMTGKITVDRKTGILREKTITTESSGSTEIMGGTLPVTSKTTTSISVK